MGLKLSLANPNCTACQQIMLIFDRHILLLVCPDLFDDIFLVY